MKITLPPRSDDRPAEIIGSARPIVIIGANGAGKTRFTDRLAHDNQQAAYKISALRGLYDRQGLDTSPSSLDSLYEKNVTVKAPTSNQLERLMALLMHDEVLNLISYKLARASDEAAALPPTRLDSVIRLWQDVFPGNRILIESGKLLFTRGYDEESYSALKLSDGERAVIYYIGSVLYAPSRAMILVESPEMFLHPTLMVALWNHIEQLRPDCRFIYTTHDLEFAASRSEASIVWVRDFDPEHLTWDYDILPPDSTLSDEMYLTIIGSRKPVLFIEGDGVHSIDSKLYPLIFKEYTVKSLGSCNKVIEATRAFSDLTDFHHMDSYGIVDRDRRDMHEVEYLRGKRVMVPDVAEIENILMLEEVIRTVAHRYGKDENRVFERVKHSVLMQFRHDLRQQAMLHTRHRVKRMVEYRIDGKFANINMLEEHMKSLPHIVNPRGLYEEFCRDFRRYLETDDYQSVLRVYNQKSMLPGSNVAGLCGLRDKEEYIKAIISILKEDGRDAARIRGAVMKCFGLDSAHHITESHTNTDDQQ